MITGTWWYFTMLVIAAYTANLTAFLTQELSGEITSLEGLIDAVRIQFMFPSLKPAPLQLL